MPVPVCPGLRGCPGHGSLSAKTKSVLDKLRWLAALLKIHPTGMLCGSGTAWTLVALGTNEHRLTVIKPQSINKTQIGFQMPSSIVTGPHPS